MIIIGVDPGCSGAVAFLDHSTGRTSVMPMPVFKIETKATGARKTKSGVRTKTEMDPVGLAQAIREEVHGQKVMAFIEEVHSMPQQGIVSCWNFAMATGIVHGVLAALEIPITRVMPTTWKKFVMGDMGKEKDAARARASQLFPALSHHFRPKSSDGLAEACLIAWYGSQQYAFAGPDPVVAQVEDDDNLPMLELVEG